MKSKRSFYTTLILIAGVIILVNLAGDRFFLRLDFTADQRYTLSKATRDILGSLKETVTVTAYISDELPQQFAQVRRDFREELIEYGSRSGGKVVYEFVNPNKDEASEQKAMQEGISPVLINVREKDQVRQQKAYMGAVLQYGDKKEVIPFIQAGSAMEYALSTSIKKMTAENKPKLAFLQGHGETPPSAMQQVMQSLFVLYDVVPVNLYETSLNPADYRTLMIVSPRDSFPAAHLAKLDEFLASGRNMVIAMNRVEGDLQNATGSEVVTGLERWLEGKGLKIRPDFVIDQSCGSVMVNQQQGYMSFQSNMQFPYLPVLTKFPDHPVTKGLSQVVLQFASSMEFTPSATGITFTPLAVTSDRSGAESAPLTFDITRNWQQQDFMKSNLIVGGLLSGKLAGGANARMIVIADGDFALNGEGQQARQIPADNLNLMVNAVDWLSDDTGLIDLRTKVIPSRPIETMEDGTRTFLKYLNFLLPLLFILGIGFFRYQWRTSLRIKRMNDNYI